MITNQLMILVRGLPGSGKSTFAKRLCNVMTQHYNCNASIFETDNFFVDCVDSNLYHFDTAFLEMAHQWNQAEVFRFCRDVYAPCIVANTFTTKEELDPYIKIARMTDRFWFIVRMKNQFQSIHNVPLSTLNRMSARFQDIENELNIQANDGSEEYAIQFTTRYMG